MNVAHPVVRVYLVEDSPILTKLLVGLIEADSGALVVGQADNARAAIAEIRSLNPDLVVLDLHLREGNGVDVIRALRTADPASSATLVVLTNHSGLPYRKAAREAGADHFFDKSTEIPLMLSLIRSLLGATRPDKR
jgi:DNA-binding NarL/FixJ family response regulator